MAERISTGKAAQICGVTSKTLLKLARDGKVPGAAELDEGLWRFDELRLRDWIRRREAACQGELGTTSTRGTALGTPECKSVGATLDAAYEQLLGAKR
jgi:predicted DNA-binding transcriptional regulator AlpA